MGYLVVIHIVLC